MEVPAWAILVSLLVALPAYILWAIGAYMFGKAIYSWVFVVDSPPPQPRKTK